MINPMLTTHGRAGKPWFATTLAASALILAVADARPATACHIKHHETTSTEPSTTASTSTTPSITPEQMIQQSFQKLLHDLPAQTAPVTSLPMIPATPPTSPTPATSTPATPVALPQILVPSPASSTPAPTVSTWHQTTSTPVMPPTPPSTCDNSPTTATQPMSQSPALSPPAALLIPPTPAPEPSTLVIVGVLAGAFAWRRRKSK
jgi:hypothetical protein